MSEFDPAFEFVIGNEGDTYTDQANDRGGPTKYGISLNFLRSIDNNATAETIKDLTRQQVYNLYREQFWVKYPFCSIKNQVIANYVFDMAIHTSPIRWFKVIQKTLNSNDVAVDGVLGTKTISAINSAPACFLHLLMDARADYYRAIVKRFPLKSKFLNGWINRAYQ